ncbi:MAG: ATP cone domain-containing protein, partial [Planctomycetota bacterium]
MSDPPPTAAAPNSGPPPDPQSAAAGPAAPGPARVRKRNGRIQPFSLSTIRRALASLTQSADGPADEWVQSWLEALQAQLRRRAESLLPTAEIHRLLSEIMSAAGRPELAARWNGYLQRKQRLRARIAVAPQRLPGLDPARDPADRPIGFVRSEWLQRLVRAGVETEAAEAVSRDLAQIVVGFEPELLTEWLVAALTRSLCLTRGITVLPADLPLSGVTPAELDAAYRAPTAGAGTGLL